MTDISTGAPLGLEEFDRLFGELSNWGRWGTDDELGTLNFLGEADVAGGLPAGEARAAGTPGPAVGHHFGPG